MSNREEPGDLSAAEGIAILVGGLLAVAVVLGGLLWVCIAGIVPAWAALLLGVAGGLVAAAVITGARR